MLAQNPAFQQINDWLWQGSMMRWAYTSEPAPDVGTAVVLAEFMGDTLDWLEDEMEVVFLPFDDSEEGVPFDVWNQLVDRLKAIDHTEGVVTICQAGENRSGLVSALLLGLKEDLPPDEAIALIRKQINPNTTMEHVLWNKGFVSNLQDRCKSISR